MLEHRSLSQQPFIALCTKEWSLLSDDKTWAHSPSAVEALWSDTLDLVSGQLYLRPPWQNSVWTLVYINPVLTHSRKRPAPVADSFSASRGCPLTGASTTIPPKTTADWSDNNNYKRMFIENRKRQQMTVTPQQRLGSLARFGHCGGF